MFVPHSEGHGIRIQLSVTLISNEFGATVMEVAETCGVDKMKGVEVVYKVYSLRCANKTNIM